MGVHRNIIDKKEASYEIIDVLETTGVKFYTSIDQGSYVPPHWHRAIEIILMQEGTLEVTLEARKRILVQGDCILINGNVIHAAKCTEPNKAVLLQIPLDFLEKYMPQVRQLLFTWDDQSANTAHRTKIEMVKHVLEQMQLVNDVRPEGFLLRFNSLLFELMYQLYHNFRVQICSSDLTQKTKDLERLRTIQKYLEKNYRNQISLNEIAGIACLQSGYFCRFFKKYMGVTFLEYQNEIRLSHIYQDLISTDDSVGLILERHGFTNYKLFRRVFHEHFGETPTQLRKRLKN